MSNIFVITKREIRSYFDSPLAYIFIVAFLLSCAVLFFFVEGFFVVGMASLRSWFGMMPVMLSILIPALTMRSWAEEKKQGTYETLMTLPFSVTELVIGKYLAAMAVIATSLLISIIMPLMLSMFGRFDPGVIFCEYLGILLLASAGVAIGQLLSSITNNQMSAFLATAFFLIVLTMLNQFIIWLKLPVWMANVFNWISLSYRFTSFSRGVLDSRDLLYFLLLAGMGLYLTARKIEAGKWR